VSLPYSGDAGTNVYAVRVSDGVVTNTSALFTVQGADAEHDDLIGHVVCMVRTNESHCLYPVFNMSDLCLARVVWPHL